MTGKDCLFCNIANGATNTDLLFENDHMVVFRDIHPAAPVHLLIVPRRHIRGINDISDEDRTLLAEMMFVARDMARKEGIDQSGYRVFFNVERGGGQVIFHLHLHLIGGWPGGWKPRSQKKETS
jgi:histidine triad (HIT) family protein